MGKVDVTSRGFQDELKAALFAGGYGVVVWTAVQFGGSVIPGTGLDDDGKRALAFVLIGAALIHSVSIKRFGWWTPLCRFFAMALHTGVFAYIAATNNSWAAVYIYGVVAAGMARGAFNAARDWFQMGGGR